jgi:cell division protein FtsB
MKFVIKNIIFIIFAVIIVVLIIVNIFLLKTKDVNDIAIKRMNDRIQNLETQLNYLQQQQSEYETRIAKLRYQKQNVKKPITDEETIKRLKDLGYNPIEK